MCYSNLHNKVTMNGIHKISDNKTQMLNFNMENIQLIESKHLSCLFEQKFSECKYCLLKQKMVNPGQQAFCLTHFLQINKKQQQISTPRTPPMKPKNQPYDNNNNALISTTNLTFDIEKLTELAQQLHQTLSKIYENINWTDHPQLLDILNKCFKCLQQNSIVQSQSSFGKISNTFQQNESSIRFDLSDQSCLRKVEPTNTFKKALDQIIYQSKQNAYVKSETISSFVLQIETRLKYYENEIVNYRQKIQSLIKMFNDKMSTDHTIKDSSDEMYFLDKLSELQDISVKYLNYQCLMCKHKGPLYENNENLIFSYISQDKGQQKNLIKQF